MKQKKADKALNQRDYYDRVYRNRLESVRTAQRELETDKGPEDLMMEKGDQLMAPLPSASTGMVTRSKGVKRSEEVN